MVVEGPKLLLRTLYRVFTLQAITKAWFRIKMKIQRAFLQNGSPATRPKLEQSSFFLEHVQHSTRVAYGYQVHVSLITGIWVRKIGSWKEDGEYA